MAAADSSYPLPLPRQRVVTRDGVELGTAQAMGCKAFKVAPPGDDTGIWLRREVIETCAAGGPVRLRAPFAELERWRWTPPPLPLARRRSLART